MQKLFILLFVSFIILTGCNNQSDVKENAGNDTGSVEKTESNNDVKENEEVEHSDVVSTKKEYLEKLNDIEKGLSEFDPVYENGTQTDMNEAKSETLKRWDNALNEIYKVLEKQLSSAEMEKLRKEQREWIKQRDKIAKEESSQFKGGTLEPFQYADTLARITKERCYELVEVYMK